MSSDENGIYAYDLAGNWCEECGRAKSFRLFPGTLTGCKTCDEVITRHRCTGRPDLEDLDAGESWECRLCGSVWTCTEVEDACPECCRECGHMVPVKRWEVVKGDRVDSAPRYKPQPWGPLRNRLPRRPWSPFFDGALRADQIPRPRECHRTASGIMVHVKPGCRCQPVRR